MLSAARRRVPSEPVGAGPGRKINTLPPLRSGACFFAPTRRLARFHGALPRRCATTPRFRKRRLERRASAVTGARFTSPPPALPIRGRATPGGGLFTPRTRKRRVERRATAITFGFPHAPALSARGRVFLHHPPRRVRCVSLGVFVPWCELFFKRRSRSDGSDPAGARGRQGELAGAVAGRHRALSLFFRRREGGRVALSPAPPPITSSCGTCPPWGR